MNRVRLLAALLAIFAAVPVAAQSRSEARRSQAIVERHMARLRTLVREADAPDVLLSVVQYDTGGPEEMIVLRRTPAGGFEIAGISLTTKLYTYAEIEFFRARVIRSGHPLPGGGWDDHSNEEAARLAATVPADYHDIGQRRCSASIDGSLADSILAHWRAWDAQVPDRNYVGYPDIISTYRFRTRAGELVVPYPEWDANWGRPKIRMIDLARSMFVMCLRGQVAGSGIEDALSDRPRG